MERDGDTTQPSRIGRFAVLRNLGAGGMGVVYSAYDEELDRKVAIKLLHREDLGTQEARSRLLREAQAMARLSHPNVVQVYEVGAHAEQVFVAMEMIDGVTLRAWLADGPPKVEDVLSKFEQAGRGLAAAHEAGIVHRDFKPENVLVAKDGRVRVLDFGLARPTAVLAAMAKLQQGMDFAELDTLPRDHHISRPLLEQVTQPGEIIGTPAYMSPEQINGGKIEAASDQFSFSVALYEALYGERPFQGSTWTELTGRIARGEITPPKRDVRVPARIRQIVLRGMATDAKQRWPNMNALLDALADDPGKKYRKWAIGALAIAAVSGPIAAISMREPPCRAAAAELERVWNPDIRRTIENAFAATKLPYATQAFAIASERLGAYAESWTRARVDACEAAFERHTQSGELFDLRMSCLERRKRELDALVSALGRAGKDEVQHASEAVYALPEVAPCGDVEQLRLAVQPPSDPELARATEEVRTQLARAQSLERLTKPREGLPVAEEALSAASKLTYVPARAEAMARVGSLRARVASSSVGVSMLLDAVDLADEQHHDELAGDIWSRLTEIAIVDLADRDRARAWNRRELAAARRLGRSAGVADALVHRGAIAYLESKLDEAEQDQREGLARAAEVLAENDPKLGDYYHSLANTLAAAGKTEEAEKTFARGLAIAKAGYGPHHPQIADILFDIALFHTEAPERAGAELGEALEIYTSAYGPDHRDTGRAYLALANLEISARQLEKAEAHALRAAAIFERNMDANSPLRSEPPNLLGAIYFMRRDYTRALAEYGVAREVLHRTLDAKEPNQGILLGNIAEALIGLGRYKDALAEAERAEGILREAVGEEHELYGYALKVKGQALFGMGAVDKALALLERAVAIDAHGSDAVDLADAKWSLARALGAARRDVNRARTLAEEARAAFESFGPVYAWRVEEINAWLPKNPGR